MAPDDGATRCEPSLRDERYGVRSSDRDDAGPDEVREPFALLLVEQRVDLPERLEHRFTKPLGGLQPLIGSFLCPSFDERRALDGIRERRDRPSMIDVPLRSLRLQLAENACELCDLRFGELELVAEKAQRPPHAERAATSEEAATFVTTATTTDVVRSAVMAMTAVPVASMAAVTAEVGCAIVASSASVAVTSVAVVTAEVASVAVVTAEVARAFVTPITALFTRPMRVRAEPVTRATAGVIVPKIECRMHIVVSLLAGAISLPAGTRVGTSPHALPR